MNGAKSGLWSGWDDKGNLKFKGSYFEGNEDGLWNCGKRKDGLWNTRCTWKRIGMEEGRETCHARPEAQGPADLCKHALYSQQISTFCC